MSIFTTPTARQMIARKVERLIARGYGTSTAEGIARRALHACLYGEHDIETRRRRAEDPGAAPPEPRPADVVGADLFWGFPILPNADPHDHTGGYAALAAAWLDEIAALPQTAEPEMP